jgi:hypothetical protein
MKKEYYDTYEMLYSEYVYENDFRRRRPFLYDEYYIIRTIRKSIDNADKSNSLRPDAKYFLIVNFHHLIVRPLFEQRPYKDRQIEKEFTELEGDIQDDIATIVSETKKEAEGEISGHQIMRTIDKVWKNLKTTRLELWG